MLSDNEVMARDAPRFGYTAPRQARSRQAVQRIVAATIDLLGRKPVEEITIGDICIEADVSASTFYMRFRNKDAVLHAIFEQYRSRSDAFMTEAMGIFTSATDLPRAVTDLLVAYREFLEDHESIRQAMLCNPELRGRHDLIDADIHRVLRDAVEMMGGGADRLLLSRVELVTRIAGLALQDCARSGAVARLLRVDEEEFCARLGEVVTVFVEWSLLESSTEGGPR